METDGTSLKGVCPCITGQIGITKKDESWSPQIKTSLKSLKDMLLKNWMTLEDTKEGEEAEGQQHGEFKL